MGAPFLGVKWGFPDDRVLPSSATARQVGDELRNDFAVNSATDVNVVIPDMSGLTPDGAGRLRRGAVARTGRVVGVVAGRHVSSTALWSGRESAATGLKDGSAFLTVNSTAPLYSQASETQLDRLHAVTTPAGREVQLAGAAQINRDSAEAVTSRLPFVLSVIAASPSCCCSC